jgi:predicted ester cyclase
MSGADNKAIAKRLIETWRRGASLDAVDELCSATFVRHGPAGEGEVRGPEGLKRLMSSMHELMPDLRDEVVDQVAEGDKVVSRWTARGSDHGREARIEGIIIHRIAGGKVEEEWAAYDAGGMMQQLGVVPPTGQSAERAAADLLARAKAAGV